MTSSLLSRVSAALLLFGGVALLFAPDAILPRLIPGYPSDEGWFGQLLGAAWLAMAELNWLSRFTVLGGIYGRSVVSANMTLFLISAIAFWKATGRPEAGPAVWLPFAVTALLALAYAALMFKGPLPADRRPGGVGQ
jgi:hypothetical protein